MKFRNAFATALLLCSLLYVEAGAQTHKVKSGARITYTAAGPGGATISLPVTFTLPAAGGMQLNYTVQQPGKSFNGKIIISGKGIESGNSINWGDLSPDDNRSLSDNETAFCFSRIFFSQLLKNKTAKYSDVTYTLQNKPAENKLKIGSKTFNVIYMVGSNGTNYWILNDPKYPLLVKVSKNQDGPDLVASAISGV